MAPSACSANGGSVMQSWSPCATISGSRMTSASASGSTAPATARTPRPARIAGSCMGYLDVRPSLRRPTGHLPFQPPAGPERIFGEWGNRESELVAVRDYFRVEDDVGERFWIYRAGDGEDAATGSHRWFLHGVFG